MTLFTTARRAVETALALGIVIRTTAHLLLLGLNKGWSRVPDGLEVRYELTRGVAVGNEPVPPPHRLLIGIWTALVGVTLAWPLWMFSTVSTPGEVAPLVFGAANAAVLVGDPVIALIDYGTQART